MSPNRIGINVAKFAIDREPNISSAIFLIIKKNDKISIEYKKRSPYRLRLQFSLAATCPFCKIHIKDFSVSLSIIPAKANSIAVKRPPKPKDGVGSIVWLKEAYE